MAMVAVLVNLVVEDKPVALMATGAVNRTSIASSKRVLEREEIIST